MPRFFTQSLTLLFISVILLPGLALGDTVIDDFTFPNPKFDVTSDTPGTTPGTDSGPASSIIGGTRDRTTTVTSPAGDGDINNQNRSPGGGGLYEFSSTPGGDGSSTLSYDAGGALNGLDVDLSGATSIDLALVSIDLTLDVTVSLFDGVNTSTLSATETVPGLISFDISTFPTPIDLTSIDRISFGFDPVLAGDFQIGLINIVGPVGAGGGGGGAVPVPEPASFLLVSGVLAMYGPGVIARRRRRSARLKNGQGDTA